MKQKVFTKSISLSVTVVFVVALCMVVFGRFQPVRAEQEGPRPQGEDVWQYITETNPYTQWSMYPDHEGVYPGKSPHGAFLKLYANDIAVRAAKENKPMPDGAILVKENYGKDKTTLMAITPMYKVKDYNPQGGDWFWAKYGPEGEIMASGKIEGCIKCHSAAKDHDWRFTEPRP